MLVLVFSFIVVFFLYGVIGKNVFFFILICVYLYEIIGILLNIGI